MSSFPVAYYPDAKVVSFLKLDNSHNTLIAMFSMSIHWRLVVNEISVHVLQQLICKITSKTSAYKQVAVKIEY